MADIKIKDIKPAGTELFADSQTFLTDLTDSELDIMGGSVAAALDAKSGCNSGFLCCITRKA